MLEEYGLNEGNIVANWQSKMRLTLDDCWQTTHNWLKGNFERI